MMKKFILFLTCALSWTLASADIMDRRISFKELPDAAQSYIKKHFPNQRVVRVDSEDDGDYDVHLSGSYEVTFDYQGIWKEVDASRKALPVSVLPQEVQRAVSSRYPQNVKIMQVERKSDRFEVELSNQQKLNVKMESSCE